jgi:SAM-dependent methyltransferase
MTSSNGQHWNPDQYAQNARFVSDLGRPVLELLAPQSGERILDLGCGDGALSLELVGHGGTVVGVDASVAMIGAARARGLDARVVDGRALPFADEFDAVFSNAALHWMDEPERVIAGVWRALRPGGRFVGEFGGHGNVAAVVGALEAALSARGVVAPTPWYFPRPDEYRALLERAGFDVRTIGSTPRPTLLPGDVRGWLATFAQPFMSALPEGDRQGLGDEVVDALRPVLRDDHGEWRVDYVRLRFAAVKPSADA